ncbi:MAG: trypsin-like serine protease [Deltaproteobacteria bacterium]|nr:trypsin-like serine protease [Deltaproteobacteria bacterium]
MRRPLPLVGVALCAAVGCGPLESLEMTGGGSVGQSIINGTPSPAGSYPTVGVILAVGTSGSYTFGQMTCTATLIAPDVLLTAGHCTENPFTGVTSQYRLYFSLTRNVASFGQSTLDLPDNTKQVSAVAPHPEFTMSAFNNFTGGLGDFKDIALMILEQAITGVEPSVLMEVDDASAIAVGASVEIVGYGQTDADDQMTFGVKNEAPSVINEVGSSEMQIGDVAPTPQKCHGDSGGPTFMEVDDDKIPMQRVVGVTSHAYDSTDCHRGGVDTRVDPYRAWIHTTMVQACSQGYRAAEYCGSGGGLPDPQLPPQPDAGTPDAARPDARRWDAYGYDLAGLPEGGLPPLPDDTVRARIGIGNSCSATDAGPVLAALAVLAPLAGRRRGRRRREQIG